ncbi:MAG: hypothetical protein RLZZ284_988 [Actinomycetota bacterium]
MTVPTPTTADDFDLPATRGFVRMELAHLRTLMIAGFASLRNELRTESKADQAVLRAELRADHDSLRAELKADMNALRAELKADMTVLRDELKAEIRAVDHRLTDVDRRLSAQLVDLTVSMERSHRSLLRWFISAQIATITVITVLVNSLRV